MTTTTVLCTLKWTAAAACSLAVGVALYAILCAPESLLRRWHLRYVAYLDRKLRNMLLTARGRALATGQIIAVTLTFSLHVATREPWCLSAIPVLVFGPALCIEYSRRRRVERIDQSVDGFMLTLANALRATPSIGNALGYSRGLLGDPMNAEVEVALQELRLGNSVDQALLNMSGRVQSVPLDSAVAALLIGRQVGGDLTRVLETTAATLRELARLQGVLRAKTAESKAQMLALAISPILVVLGFDWLSPGYFQPLADSWIGWIVTGTAAMLWLTALLIAQRVLAVDP